MWLNQGTLSGESSSEDLAEPHGPPVVPSGATVPTPKKKNAVVPVKKPPVTAPLPRRPSPPPGNAVARRAVSMHLWGGRPVVMVGPVGCGKTTLAKWAIAQQVGGGRARVVTTEDLLSIHHDTDGGNLSESLRVMNRSVRTRTVLFLDDLVAVMSREAVRAVTGEFATIHSPALAVVVTVDADTYWGSAGAPLRGWKDTVQVRMFEPGFRDIAGTFGAAAARFAAGDLRQAATFRSGVMGSGVLGGTDREIALMDAYRHLERADECDDVLRDLVFEHYPHDVSGSDAVASMAAVATALSDTDTMGYGRPARCALGLHLRAAPLIGQPPKKRVRRPRAGGRADTVRAADVALSGPMHAGRNTIESMDRLWLFRAKALAGGGLCPGLPKGAAAFMADLGGLAPVVRSRGEQPHKGGEGY